MTIPEICRLLQNELLAGGYRYGFTAAGVQHTPRLGSFDAEYDRQARTLYRVQPPELTMREKIGTCVDAVLVMRHLLAPHRIPNKIWLLYRPSGGAVHTVLTFEAEGQVVYLELTPQSGKPWYGKPLCYPTEEAFLQAFEADGFEVTEVTGQIVPGQPPDFLLCKLR